MLSIVIPVLNARMTLPDTIRCVVADADEIVVVDGGSTDGSVAAAAALGARVVTAPAGRGQQLDAGAAATCGDWLLFLHGDTRLAAGWADAIRPFMASAEAGCAAYFRLVFDDASPAARRTERLAAWRARWLGLPYGDQGLLIGRAAFETLGGYRGLPLMEDVDLVRRIGRRRLVALPVDAVTSAAKYRQAGWTLRALRNLACLALYFFGVSPKRIRRIYG